MFRKFFAVSMISLGLAACDDTLEKECAKFPDWQSETGMRAFNTVPLAERQAANTYAEQAAWLRKLADAYEAESKKPSIFTEPRVQAYETRQKDAYAQRAVALRLTADGWDKGDKAMVEQGQINDSDTGNVIADISKDWLDDCNK